MEVVIPVDNADMDAKVASDAVFYIKEQACFQNTVI